MIGALINALTKNPEPAAERRIFAGKSRAGANIGEIENEIVDRVAFVFERGGDGETFARLEKRKRSSASRRRTVRFDQTETAPGISGRRDDCRRSDRARADRNSRQTSGKRSRAPADR